MPRGAILIMKRSLLIVCWFTITAILAFSQQVELKKKPTAELLASMNSYSALLFDLAQERFDAHEAKKQTWIFAVNESVGDKSLRKFTDGEITIVSVPALDHESEG